MTPPPPDTSELVPLSPRVSKKGLMGKTEKVLSIDSLLGVQRGRNLWVTDKNGSWTWEFGTWGVGNYKLNRNLCPNQKLGSGSVRLHFKHGVFVTGGRRNGTKRNSLRRRLVDSCLSSGASPIVSESQVLRRLLLLRTPGPTRGRSVPVSALAEREVVV